MKLMQTVKTEKINRGSVMLVDTQGGICYKLVKDYKKPGIFISTITEDEEETDAIHYLDSSLTVGKIAKLLGYPRIVNEYVESVSKLTMSIITRIEYYAD